MPTKRSRRLRGSLHEKALVLQYAAHSISCDLRTMRATLRLNSSRLSRHILAASILAGDSSFGDDSMEMMLIMIDSTWRKGVMNTQPWCVQCTNRMHRAPALCSSFVAVWIVSRAMKDGYAHTPVQVH